MGTSVTSTGITFPDATTQTTAAASAFSAGTLMLFQQTAAPTGWTKQTTHNNKALRVVSGAASSGGTTAFTTVFTNQTPTISGGAVAATTLTTTQMPSHSHTYSGIASNAVGSGGSGVYGDPIGTPVINNTGGGSSHTHSFTQPTSSAITLNVQYVDLIIASKD